MTAAGLIVAALLAAGLLAREIVDIRGGRAVGERVRALDAWLWAGGALLAILVAIRLLQYVS